MCKVSSKLKLCTCAVPDVSRLRFYWVLHRFDPRKDVRRVGRVARPDVLDARDEAHNRTLLLARLQEPDAFDVDLEPREGDRLQLTFRFTERDRAGRKTVKEITYGYARIRGRWVEEKYDPLLWHWHHDRERFGELRPAVADGKP
jgi:hypothetical protein